jgi:hypothetical protein
MERTASETLALLSKWSVPAVEVTDFYVWEAKEFAIELQQAGIGVLSIAVPPLRTNRPGAFYCD